jgi:hypothetical protein
MFCAEFQERQFVVSFSKHLSAVGNLLFCFVLAGLLASAGIAKAQYIDCNANPYALAEAGISANGSYPIQGTCKGPITINVPSVSIYQYDNGGFQFGYVGEQPTATIQGYIQVYAPSFTLASVKVDGTGLTDTAMPYGILMNGAANVLLENVYVENFGVGSGIQVTGGSTVTMEGVQISGSSGCGLQINGPSMVFAEYQGIEITGNSQGGVCLNDGAVLTGAIGVSDNGDGAAVTVIASTLDIGGTVSVPAIDPTTNNPLIVPSIVATEGKLLLGEGSITGNGYASAISATAGTSIQMTYTTVMDADGTDPTILVADGSSLVSYGANTISNTATNGIAIEATNGSIFHQRTGLPPGVDLRITPTTQADTITGMGSIQMESNFELGTGKSTPSTWNGSIAVSQNSSFRMRGGMTINGSVTLAQGSNGFFNLSNNPGVANNVITGGVLCPFTTRQSSAVSVSGNAAVTMAGGSTSAVTFGSAPNNCSGF